MSIPAYILVEARPVGLRVAGLTVLDRLLVTLHRAGFGPLRVVGTGPWPELSRTRAWGIPVEMAAPGGRASERALVIAGNLVLEQGVARTLRELGGRLVGEGGPLPAGMVEAGAPLGWEALDGLAPRPVAGVALEVTDGPSAARAADRLWSTVTSSSDGLVDRHFNRPVGRWMLSRWLVSTGVTPNQISVAATVVGLAGAWLLARGDPRAAVAGALVFQASAAIDCVDGDVARMAFKESPLGRWLDLGGDQVVHVAVFIGIALGLARQQVTAPVGGLAASAVAGALIAFGLVLWNQLRPPTRSAERLQRLIDGATTRDFSVLVLGLAWAGRLEWFLWMAAVGSHVFWVALLGLRLWGGQPAGGPGRGAS